MLFIVSTPIWNLEDITLRALRILKEADIIACEDTRVTGKLLEYLSIPNNKRLLSFHSHSHLGRLHSILQSLQEGKNVALVCDAGTPGISDPGALLIQEAIRADIPVTPIPWASAVLSALVASGFDTHQFLYLGFLPVKKGRKTLLDSFPEKKYPVVIYESVHRILKTLSELEAVLGSEHTICVAREITKKFEEFRRGPIHEIRAYYEGEGKCKGEFVLIF